MKYDLSIWRSIYKENGDFIGVEMLVGSLFINIVVVIIINKRMENKKHVAWWRVIKATLYYTYTMTIKHTNIHFQIIKKINKLLLSSPNLKW